MNIRVKYALLAVFVGVLLVMPMYAGSGSSTPRLSSSVLESAPGPQNVAAIEVMDSFVDPWGGVYNAIGGMYNASHYSFSHITALENIVKHQMQNDHGYVTMSVLQLAGMSVFPNGVIGAPMAILQMRVRPVLVVPTNRQNTAFENLTQSEAIAIGDEFASAYESALTIDLQRFMILASDFSDYFYHDVAPSVHSHGTEYWISYIALLTDTQGLATMDAMLTRLGNLGGLMSIVDAPNWPKLMTTAGEAYFPYTYSPFFDDPSSMVMNMIGGDDPYVRSSNINDTQKVESAVIGNAAFTWPGYVTPVSGNETYSLKTHVGYTGSIQNKMQQDSSAQSISLIGGQAPGSLTVYGIPSDWLKINDQFKLPDHIHIDGITIPENATISDAIRMTLSALPRNFALDINHEIGDIDNSTLDFIVDDVWGGIGPFPDIRQLLLAFNYTTIDTPVTEMNYDLLALTMKRAGMTPDTLISNIDPTIAAKTPIGAIVKAFVKYFDTYHVLDILEADNYADPVNLEGYLNTFITGVETALHDFGGLDLPTQFTTKEGLATFVEEHWGILLQALWDAMADHDLPGIKDAFHKMLNATNLQTHVTPYLMADLGASQVAGLGFQFGLNFNGTAFFPLSVSDLTLSFDSDPESLTLSGPYVGIVKSADKRTLSIGEEVTYTITVRNYGSGTAYDVKVLDGMSAGLDGERPYYWTKSTLAADETWTFAYKVKASDAGLFLDMPAICVYFNQSLSTFDPNDAGNWTGSARYTLSAIGYQISVSGGWLSTTTLLLIAGVGGLAVVAVALLVIRRRS